MRNAAGGSSVSPAPRRPEARPRLRKAYQVQAAPMAVSTVVSAAQVTSSTPPTLAHPSTAAPDGCGDAGCRIGECRDPIPDPGFPDDDGAADPAVTAALAAYASGDGHRTSRRWPRCGRPAAGPGGRGRSARWRCDDRRAGPRQDQRHGGGAAHPARRPPAGCWPSPAPASLAAWNPEARPVPVPRPPPPGRPSRSSADGAGRRRRRPGPLRGRGRGPPALAAGWQLARVGERSAWIRPPAE